MNFFAGRLDLLLIFIAQVVQIIFGILIYVRVAELSRLRKLSFVKTSSASKSHKSEHHGMIAAARFAHALHRKRKK